MSKTTGHSKAVRCNSCKNLNISDFCVVKKEFTHINKKRRCAKYDRNPDISFGETNTIPTIRVPDKITLKKQRYAYRKATKNLQTTGYSEDNLVSMHPLTGDLSAFKTSASTDVPMATEVVENNE